MYIWVAFGIWSGRWQSKLWCWGVTKEEVLEKWAKFGVELGSLSVPPGEVEGDTAALLRCL